MSSGKKPYIPQKGMQLPQSKKTTSDTSSSSSEIQSTTQETSRQPFASAVQPVSSLPSATTTTVDEYDENFVVAGSKDHLDGYSVTFLNSHLEAGFIKFFLRHSSWRSFFLTLVIGVFIIFMEILQRFSKSSNIVFSQIDLFAGFLCALCWRS